MVSTLNYTLNVFYYKAEFIYNTRLSWIRSKLLLLLVIPKVFCFFFYIASHSPDPENSNGTDLLAFKVVQSQVEKTSDKVSVFQYGTSFLPSK